MLLGVDPADDALALLLHAFRAGDTTAPCLVAGAPGPPREHGLLLAGARKVQILTEPLETLIHELVSRFAEEGRTQK